MATNHLQVPDSKLVRKNDVKKPGLSFRLRSDNGTETILEKENITGNSALSSAATHYLQGKKLKNYLGERYNKQHSKEIPKVPNIFSASTRSQVVSFDINRSTKPSFTVYNDNAKEQDKIEKDVKKLPTTSVEKTNKNILPFNSPPNKLLQIKEHKTKKIVRIISPKREDKHLKNDRIAKEIPKVYVNKKFELSEDSLSLNLIYNFTYMNEYVDFQSMKCNEVKLCGNFLKYNITFEQRSLVIKYLLHNAAVRCYPSFIAYQAVKIFDSYIDSVPVDLSDLQVSALAALWIALKKDITNTQLPNSSAILQLAGQKLRSNAKLLCEYEKKILKGLKFEVSYVDPFSLLSLLTVTLLIETFDDEDENSLDKVYYFGSYMIDLSLMNSKLYYHSIIHIVCISVEISLTLFSASSVKNIEEGDWLFWRRRVYSIHPLLEKGRRISDVTKAKIRNELLQSIYNSRHKGVDMHTVFKKYNTRRYGGISNDIVAKVTELLNSKNAV